MNLSSERKRPSLLMAHLALFAVAVFYAANYFIAKRAVFAHIDSFALVALRSIAAIIVFGSISLFVIKEKIDRKDWLRLFACGMFGVAINQTFFLWGLSKTVELNAGIIMTMTPVFVFLIALAMGEEKITGRKGLGLTLACIGAVMISLGGKNLTFDKQHIIGDVMVGINALSYAFYLVLVRSLSVKYNTFTLIGWIFIIGGCITIPLGLPSIMAIDLVNLPLSAWLGTVYVLVFTTFLTYSFNAWSMKRVPSSQVGVYIYVQPVLVTIIAAIGFRGSINAEKLGYILLVLVGVFFVSFRRGFGKKQKV